jgi:isopropylmalate/homocitrate/citramalate synthase
MNLGLKFPEVTSWIRANKKDFELVKQMGIKETGILVSCSDYHIFKKMNLNRAQALDKYLGTVKDALAAAQKDASKEDIIFIGGSNYVVGEVLSNTHYLRTIHTQ